MKSAQPSRWTVGFAGFSIVFGILGLFASFELLTEYIKTLVTPEYIPNCSISKLVTCGPNMGSSQGSVFGFSNTILGIAGFVAPVFVGAALLAGGEFKRWFWGVYLLGVMGALVFVSWLQYQSIFMLGTLCPWCMVVWVTVIPLFWVSVFELGGRGLLGVRGKAILGRARSWSWVFIAIHVLLVAGVAQIVLDWFHEFSLR
ncbi:vitamin K epoxide reductase family protein [Leucobacter sp.]